jgi:gamma-glutamylaminecyclotransferase
MSGKSMETELVFFYGTLMRGQANHRVLVDVGARFVGEAATVDAWRLLDLGPYPALVRLVRAGASAKEAGGGRVAGEVFAVGDAAIEALDVFEGCPDLYARERIAVEVEGKRIDAWTYVLASEAPAHAVVIASRRYADRK